MKVVNMLKELDIKLNMIVSRIYRVKVVGLSGICHTIRKEILRALMSFTMILLKRSLGWYSASVEKNICTAMKEIESLNTHPGFRRRHCYAGVIEAYTIYN